MKRLFGMTAIALALGAAVIVGAGQGQGGGTDRLTAELLKGIELRSIGPTLATGRIADVAIDPKNTNVWYVATAFGGLWKTVNRGISFAPVFDDGGSFTLCCVVVDPKDSNVVWLGTGENTSQRSAHFGDGVYKSIDAGKSWKRVALASSEHIGKILVDPRNSKVVYVASQGPLWSAGGERGLYKTLDGGATWNAVLTVSPDTGISDIVFDPKNADVIYASAYQRRRAVGQMIGGGPEGGILQDHQRRQDLDEAHEGTSDRRHGEGRPCGGRPPVACDGIRDRRREARGSGLLPVGRCGRHLDEDREDDAGRRPGRLIGGPSGHRLVPRRRRAVLPRDLRAIRTAPTPSTR